MSIIDDLYRGGTATEGELTNYATSLGVELATETLGDMNVGDDDRAIRQEYLGGLQMVRSIFDPHHPWPSTYSNTPASLADRDTPEERAEAIHIAWETFQSAMRLVYQTYSALSWTSLKGAFMDGAKVGAMNVHVFVTGVLVDNGLSLLNEVNRWAREL